MKVPNTDANSLQCVCGDCPSYVEGKDEGFFARWERVRKSIQKKDAYAAGVHYGKNTI
jgi:hypothetical protein